MKKVLLFMGAMIICSCIQLNAQTATAPAIGDGTSGNPYQISSLENLYWMATQVATGGKSFDNQNFIQTADIDASATSGWTNTYGAGKGDGFLAIGTKYNNATLTTFKGNYDGQNHTISGIWIKSGSNCVGLFGNIATQDTIQNVRLTNVNITSTVQNVGGLIGQKNETTTTLTLLNCSVTGTINTSSTGNTQVGGLVGVLQTQATVRNCYSGCSINASGAIAGGLIGTMNTASIISDCYAMGALTASNTVGGFIGSLTGTVTFNNCYSTGLLTTAGATKGGFVGSLSGTTAVANNCLWDTEVSTQSNAVGGTGTFATGSVTGAAVSQMQSQATYSGWNFTTTWGIASGFKGGYPYLTAFTPMATAATNVASSGFTATWAAVAGATGYQLDVAADAAFTNMVANNVNVSGTSKDITGLTAATQYYYRVRSVNNVTSENSNVISVTTSIATAVSGSTGNMINIKVNNGTLGVENVASFIVYNVQGIKVAEVRENSGAPVVNLKQGVYIVKSGNSLQKVIVK